MAAQPLSQMVSSAARFAVRAAAATAMGVKEGIRLADCVPRELVDDIFGKRCLIYRISCWVPLGTSLITLPACIKMKCHVLFSCFPRTEPAGIQRFFSTRPQPQSPPSAVVTDHSSCIEEADGRQPQVYAGFWQQSHRAPACAEQPVPAQGAASQARSPRGRVGKLAVWPVQQDANTQGQQGIGLLG